MQKRGKERERFIGTWVDSSALLGNTLNLFYSVLTCLEVSTIRIICGFFVGVAGIVMKISQSLDMRF